MKEITSLNRQTLLPLPSDNDIQALLKLFDLLPETEAADETESVCCLTLRPDEAQAFLPSNALHALFPAMEPRGIAMPCILPPTEEKRDE